MFLDFQKYLMIQNLELTNQDKRYHNSPPEEILNPMQNLLVAILSSGLKYYPYRDSPLPASPILHSYIQLPAQSPISTYPRQNPIYTLQFVPLLVF